MSPWQILPGQISPWHLESVLDVLRNLHLKFHQYRVSNSGDIADIEFVWWGGVGGGGWCAKSFSCLTQLEVMLGWVELWLTWGFDNFISKNFTIWTPLTGAYSPNQNGLCEKNHQLVDKMMDDDKNLKFPEAKNTLANVYGFPPYSLSQEDNLSFQAPVGTIWQD